MKTTTGNVGGGGEGVILDGLVEHFSTRRQWKALGENFIHRRPLLYCDSPGTSQPMARACAWFPHLLAYIPNMYKYVHVQDHWAFLILLLIGVLERTTLPSRNHKQIPLVLTGGRSCSWVMPRESRTDLFEVRIEQSDSWRSDKPS